MRRDGYKTAVMLAVLGLAGCSGPSSTSSPKTETKEAEPPPVAVTAKTAYWEMYKLAYQWDHGVQALSMKAGSVPGIQNADGKAGLWEAHFGAVEKKQARKFTYCVLSKPPDYSKGVSVDDPVPWLGPTRDAMTFTSSDFATDSDVAYATARAEASKWLAKHPGAGLTEMSLGSSYRYRGPVWYLMWGTKKDGYIAIISATTGKAFKARE
jgi:hypothetical protein